VGKVVPIREGLEVAERVTDLGKGVPVPGRVVVVAVEQGQGEAGQERNVG
jgi:hypothetical protein